MQLTLSSTPFAKPPVVPKVTAQPARPRDVAALSQLDQIAAQNLQATKQGLGGTALFLALVGGLVILGSASMWSSGSDESRKPPAAAHTPKATPAEAPPLSSQTVAATVTAAAAAPAMVAAPVQPTEPAPQPALATAAAPEALVAADDAARKARAKQQAEARRKAAQGAQERALAEETQRLQLAQQREAERAQQLAEQARQRAAAEQARLASAQSVSDTRRGVGETCASAGGFVSRQFCHARECRKAEHQGDSICVSLRETEAAQLRASAER
jgi:hypothetical protein